MPDYLEDIFLNKRRWVAYFQWLIDFFNHTFIGMAWQGVVYRVVYIKKNKTQKKNSYRVHAWCGVFCLLCILAMLACRLLFIQAISAPLAPHAPHAPPPCTHPLPLLLGGILVLRLSQWDVCMCMGMGMWLLLYSGIQVLGSLPFNRVVNITTSKKLPINSNTQKLYKKITRIISSAQ